MNFFLFLLQRFFLADRIGGSGGVGEVRDMAVFSQTAQSSLKRPGPNIWRMCVCVLSVADPLVAQRDSHFII